MLNENLGVLENSCSCLFNCECTKVEKIISDWTSPEALETVKRGLLSLSNPTDIFARFACVLFFRQILDGVAVKSTKDNLRKATIAFSFAASFANEEIDCFTFYTSCWQRFQHLASMLDVNLSHITVRRRLPLILFVDEVFSLDSVDSNIATSRAVEVQGEQIVGQFVKPNSEFSPEIPLEEVSPQLDHSIPEALQSLDNRQIDGSASNSEESNFETLPPLISTIVDALCLDCMDDLQPMLSLDSNEPNRDPSPTSQVANEQNARQFDGYQPDLDDPSLDEEKPPADFVISEPDLQNENVSLRGTRSMPAESANERVVERSASKEEKKKPKMETPVATNGLESTNKKITEPGEEPQEVAEQCATLIATTSPPCENVRTKIVKRSENPKERVGEPEKKRARPIVVAAGCSSSSEHAELQTSSRPSMEADTQSEPMEQSEDVVTEADVPLSNTSRPRRTRRTRTAMIAVEADDNDDDDEQPAEKRVSERSCENCKSARKSTNKATTYFMIKFWYEKGDRPLSRDVEELSKKSNLTTTQVQLWFKNRRRRKGLPNESIERSMLSTGRRENSYFAYNTSRKLDNSALLLKEFYNMIDHPFPCKTQIEKIAAAAELPHRKVYQFFRNRCGQLRAHITKKSVIISKQLKQFNISEEQLLSFGWMRNRKGHQNPDSRTSEMLCRFYAVNMDSEGKVMTGDIPESTRSLLVQLTGWEWRKKTHRWFLRKQQCITGKSLAILRSMAQLIRHPHEFRFGVGRNEKFDYFEDRYID